MSGYIYIASGQLDFGASMPQHVPPEDQTPTRRNPKLQMPPQQVPTHPLPIQQIPPQPSPSQRPYPPQSSTHSQEAVPPQQSNLTVWGGMPLQQQEPVPAQYAPQQKRFGFLALSVASGIALIVGAALGATLDGGPRTAEPTGTVTATATATKTVTETAGSERTEGSTDEPTEEPPEAPPPPKPDTYSGSGDEVVKFKKALTEPMLMTTTWRGGSDNNTISAYDADGNEGELLVNTIGSYKGTNIINLYEGDNVKALKVEGSGKWKVTLRPLTAAKRWDGSGTYEGKSDDVINVEGVFDGLDSMRFRSTGADGNITVEGLGENGEDLIVNEIGNFSGKYLVPSDTVLLRISSDGRWEMRKA